MKQIKTIKNRLDNATSFDEEVNAALAKGWQLTRRDVIRPNAHPTNGETIYTVLYAELEREAITEEEKCCENCAHYNNAPSKEPCRSCEDGDVAPTKWEVAK